MGLWGWESLRSGADVLQARRGEGLTGEYVVFPLIVLHSGELPVPRSPSLSDSAPSESELSALHHDGVARSSGHEGQRRKWGDPQNPRTQPHPCFLFHPSLLPSKAQFLSLLEFCLSAGFTRLTCFSDLEFRLFSEPGRLPCVRLLNGFELFLLCLTYSSLKFSLPFCVCSVFMCIKSF